MRFLTLFKKKDLPVKAAPYLINYNEAQINLIHNMFAPNATKEEFELFLYMSRIYGLNILTREMQFVKYSGKDKYGNDNKAQIYSGRDGFLMIGHRIKTTEGLMAFDGMDTKVEKVSEPFQVSYYDKSARGYKNYTQPFQYKAICTVYRKDMGHPITVEVYEDEYSTAQNLWKTKRRTMIGKVAESQCLRKSFKITGIYSPEEMGQWELEAQGTPVSIESERKGIKGSVKKGKVKADEVTGEIIDGEVIDEKIETPVVKKKDTTAKPEAKETTTEPPLEDLIKRYQAKYPTGNMIEKLQGNTEVLKHYLSNKYKSKEI